ncbi:hypothetical protein BGX26_009475 [Mortierella sp. AD094]|nr:hypothetical protein BGX26_009475 [Mortierella sp. AD094]
MKEISLPHYKFIDWRDPDISYQMYLCAISLFLDVALLLYYLSAPFHPKYSVKTTRRRVINIHIISGSLEIYYRLKLFEEHRFTAGMFTSMLFLAPSLLGLPGIAMVMTGIFAFDAFLQRTSKPDFWASWTKERPREIVASPKRPASRQDLSTSTSVEKPVQVEAIIEHNLKEKYAKNSFKANGPSFLSGVPNSRACTLCKAISRSRDDQLSVVEFHDFLESCEIHRNQKTLIEMTELLFAGRDVVPLEDFRVWYSSHTNSAPPPPMPKTPQGQAKLIFETLDYDGSGYLDLTKIQDLIVSWGLPEDEAVLYLKQTVKDGSDKIYFPTFYHSTSPVWKFAIQSFVDENKVLIEI